MDKLPIEITFKIFDDLSLNDLNILKSTSKHYSFIVNSYFKHNNYNHLLYSQFSKDILNKIKGKHLKLNLTFRQIIYFIITGKFTTNNNPDYPLGSHQIDNVILDVPEKDAFGIINKESIILSVYDNIEKWEKCKRNGLGFNCKIHNQYLDENNNVVPAINNREWYLEGNKYNLSAINKIILSKQQINTKTSIKSNRQESDL